MDCVKSNDARCGSVKETVGPPNGDQKKLHALVKSASDINQMPNDGNKPGGYYKKTSWHRRTNNPQGNFQKKRHQYHQNENFCFNPEAPSFVPPPSKVPVGFRPQQYHVQPPYSQGYMSQPVATSSGYYIATQNVAIPPFNPNIPPPPLVPQQYAYVPQTNLHYYNQPYAYAPSVQYPSAGYQLAPTPNVAMPYNPNVLPQMSVPQIYNGEKNF